MSHFVLNGERERKRKKIKNLLMIFFLKVSFFLFLFFFSPATGFQFMYIFHATLSCTLPSYTFLVACLFKRIFLSHIWYLSCHICKLLHWLEKKKEYFLYHLHWKLFNFLMSFFVLFYFFFIFFIIFSLHYEKFKKNMIS